uniref:protein-histidine N-methyltransferase n=1 Tax=Lotharella oceanica TaxID=641309 RepID=A0A7S2XIE4_9EUKA
MAPAASATPPRVKSERVTPPAIPSKDVETKPRYDVMKIGSRSMKVAMFDHRKELDQKSALAKILEKSDLQPEVYEGGFKVWECACDLVTYLEGQKYEFSSKNILDFGCGHGLPGILALNQGARLVCFQDLNAEVLRHVTIPNILLNTETTADDLRKSDANTWLIAGNWADPELMKLMGGRKWDCILTSDTLYSLDSIPHLVRCIEKLLSPKGECFVAAKRYYFGIGGSTAALIDEISESTELQGEVIRVFDDGKSNLRELIRVVRKPPTSEAKAGQDESNDGCAGKKGSNEVAPGIPTTVDTRSRNANARKRPSSSVATAISGDANDDQGEAKKRLTTPVDPGGGTTAS